MRILVINPNSLTDCTAAIDTALNRVRDTTNIEIDCVTMEEGPPGIETQYDLESVVMPVADRIKNGKADAYVIACFSDAGINLAREITDKPVLGIGESGFHLAASLGSRFGIIAMGPRNIPRHVRYVRSLGLYDRLAGDRPIKGGSTVAGLSNRNEVIDKIVDAGEVLRDQDGANVVVLGCANMGRYRPELEERLAMPVVDPSEAAVARAVSMLSLGYTRSHLEKFVNP